MPGTTYFHRLSASTATRVWINNPTPAEALAAMAEGAVSCTSNPTYCARMLREDRTEALAAIDACLPQSTDDAVVADLVQQRLLRRIMDVFAPAWDPARRDAGDPRFDTDAEHIIREVRSHRGMAPNYLAKIPATAAGLVAIRFCLEEDIPVIATEVFSLSQALAVADLHREVLGRTRRRTPLYLTHISGIFDDCLALQARNRGLAIAPDLVRQAGVIVAREQYRILSARGYDGIVMLGGGARGIHHFTEVVGGTMHVTINPGTMQDLVRLDPPVADRIHAPVPASVVAELCDAFPDFRIALIPGAQRPEAFADYAPVRHFLAAFIAGWEELLAAIAARRKAG
jgi:transaldolase